MVTHIAIRSNLSLDPSHNGKRGLHQEFCSVFLQVCADKGVGWPPERTGRRKRGGEEKEGRGGEGGGGGGRDWEYSLSSAPQFSSTQLEKGSSREGQRNTGWLDISARRACFYLRENEEEEVEEKESRRKSLRRRQAKARAPEKKKTSTRRKVKNKSTQHHLVAILASASENSFSS